MSTPIRIAIIGAGPGGLMCARILQQRGFDASVYDADASTTARDAGGTLDLHADSGQIALEDAGLMDAFNALARPEGQAKRSLDYRGNVLAAFMPDENDTAASEIDRGQLRTMLYEHVEPETVRWGHKLIAVTPFGNGVHRLKFANGVTAEADLVIGADGAWSRVRPLVSSATPYYTGISFLDIRFADVANRHPQITKLVGDGHMFVNYDGRAIIGQRNSSGYVRGYVGMRADADWYKKAGIDLDDKAAVSRFLLTKFNGWADELLPFITDTDGNFVNRAIYVLPAPLIWAPTPGVTLLGDAAHLMSPFGGFGVNLAMLDAAELARAITEETSIDAAISRYEATMLPRAGKHAVGANAALDRFFAPGDADPRRVPNPAAEHQKFRDAANEYRRNNST